MRFITIQFNDGSKVKYSFPVQAANKAATQLKLEDFFKGRHLVVQVEARLVVYPVENIRAVEFSAGSGGDLEGIRLPAHTIRDAKPVGG
jgi:hypothetical protein